MKSRLPVLVFGLVYVLVLATQLPHVWAAYASLEDPTIPLARYTAAGAAIAFELSIGVFTYRIIKGSRRRWTKRGLAFFIVASGVANAYYYELWPLVFDFVFRLFATLALPFALALFAEEFGALERNIERRERRAERTKAKPKREPARYACKVAGCEFVARSQNGLNAHMRSHRTKGEQA